MNNWISIKLGLIALATVLYSTLGAITEHADPPFTPFSLMMIFLFGVLGLQFVLGLQTRHVLTGSLWKQPSWHASLLDVQQPIQWVHFSSWGLILMPAPRLIQTYLYNPVFLYDALAPFLLGLGLLGGIYLSLLVFRTSYEQ